mmetsp:Transcript_43795/g.121820  ORF Transcript_43795/g.121820 Transcript_43795/m.121820 type:complete len:243 (-) Transcript_43795:42-770(-)
MLLARQLQDLSRRRGVDTSMADLPGTAIPEAVCSRCRTTSCATSVGRTFARKSARRPLSSSTWTSRSLGSSPSARRCSATSRAPGVRRSPKSCKGRRGRRGRRAASCRRRSTTRCTAAIGPGARWASMGRRPLRAVVAAGLCLPATDLGLGRRSGSVGSSRLGKLGASRRGTPGRRRTSASRARACGRRSRLGGTAARHGKARAPSAAESAAAACTGAMPRCLCHRIRRAGRDARRRGPGLR